MSSRYVNQNNEAWLAGFFEGEGHIGICKRTDQKMKWGYQLYLQVTVTNNDESLLAPFLFYGGRIIRVSKRWRGLRWYISSQKAAAFLQTFLPYLRSKKERQAELAIRFQSLVGKRWAPSTEEEWQERVLLYEQINQLNLSKGTHKIH